MRIVQRFCELLFDFLNIGQPLAPADLIFVFAGRPERKVLAVDLWKNGTAPELILSVGRFEWRRFYTLDLPGDGGLQKLVQDTLPADRHFFVQYRELRSSASLIRQGFLGTPTEGRALAGILRKSHHRSLNVISTSIHLRRIRLVLRRQRFSRPVDFRFIAVPEGTSPLKREDLAASWPTRMEVLKEFVKYLLYVLFLWR